MLDFPDVRLRVGKILTEEVERPNLLPARPSIICGIIRPGFPESLVTPHAFSNFARAFGLTTAWYPGKIFGRAPMSQAPWTLFWPR